MSPDNGLMDLSADIVPRTVSSVTVLMTYQEFIVANVRQDITSW